MLMCGFDGVSNCNYFGGDSVNRTKVELRMKKLRNDQAASNNEVARKVLELECSKNEVSVVTQCGLGIWAGLEKKDWLRLCIRRT